MGSTPEDVKTLTGAMIGFGRIAEGHLTGLRHHPRLTISDVVDPSPERQRAARHLIPGVRVHATVEGLAPDRLDFIDICTPPAQHLAGIAYGLTHDLAVLCEKPLLLDVADIATVEALQAGSGGFLYPCHNYLFDPSLMNLIGLVETYRQSAQPSVALFRVLRRTHGKGASGWDPDWRRAPAIGGGGVLQDLAPHSMYIATTIMASAPSTIRCQVRYPVSGPFRETEEYSLLSMAFAKGGVVNVELDWTASVTQTSYLVAGPWGQISLVDDDLEIRAGGRAERLVTPSDFNRPGHPVSFRNLWKEFIAAFADRSRAERRRAEAYGILRLIDAAYRSAATGTEVQVGY